MAPNRQVQVAIVIILPILPILPIAIPITIAMEGVAIVVVQMILRAAVMRVEPRGIILRRYLNKLNSYQLIVLVIVVIATLLFHTEKNITFAGGNFISKKMNKGSTNTPSSLLGMKPASLKQI